MKSSPLPWFCYAGFNLLILWNFLTFAQDSSSVFGLGGNTGLTSLPWLAFSLVQVGCTALIALARNSVFATLRHRFWGKVLLGFAPIAVAVGSMAMLLNNEWSVLLGGVLAAAGYALLWGQVASWFIDLNEGQAEQIVVWSTFVVVGLALILSVLPPTARFLCSQLMPVATLVCSFKTSHWLAAVETTNPSAVSEVGGSFAFVVPAVSEKANETTDMPWKAIFSHNDIIGLAFSPFLVFLSTSFLRNYVIENDPWMLSLSVIIGFALTGILTSLFLRLTPSLGFSYISRWQAPVFALALVASELELPPVLSLSLLTMLLTTVTEFVCLHLYRFAKQSNKSESFKVFMFGYALYYLAGFIGSLLASALIPLAQSGVFTFHDFGFTLLLLIVLASSTVSQSWQRKTEQLNVAFADSDDADLAEALSLDPYEEFYRRYGITPREREIVELWAAGRSAAYIRDVLFISQNTVNTHIKHVYAKTDVRSKQDLISLMESVKEEPRLTV